MDLTFTQNFDYVCHVSNNYIATYVTYNNNKKKNIKKELHL
jgi:hypothetical protein